MSRMSNTAFDPYAVLVARVFKTAGEMRRTGDAIAAEVGQTQARWQLIWVVSQKTQPVPDAARELGVTRQSVQRLADELAEEGVLEFLANPRHQRSPLLRLTKRGEDVLARLTAATRRHNQRMVRMLGAERINVTRDALERILRTLQDA
nr:MarR family transcriptional regulator [Vitreimonas sp.]